MFLAVTALADNALETVTSHFVESHDFNGILASRLSTILERPWPDLLAEIERLLSDGKISIAFYSFQDNPHVLRLKPPAIDRQLELLRSERPDEFCIYPTADVLIHRKDLAVFAGRPFSRRLALGEPQLEPVFFELAALEAYFRDPRYEFSYDDRDGRISIRDEAYRSSVVLDRDKVLLETFGIAYDEHRNRVVVVYLRYLSDLTPEHQQIWNARVVHECCVMNSDYARATLYGLRPQHHSAYQAFLAELGQINGLSTLIGKPALFRDDHSAARPAGFHPMLRPTLRGFEDFVHLLDKLLSENLNRDFFRGDIQLEEEIHRNDGKVQVQLLGTVRLLGDWLSKHYRNADGIDVASEIVEPLKTIRRLRQRPAHAVEQDAFDLTLPSQQDELVAEALRSLQRLRLVLMSHPKARGTYKPPDWLDGEDIVFY